MTISDDRVRISIYLDPRDPTDARILRAIDGMSRWDRGRYLRDVLKRSASRLAREEKKARRSAGRAVPSADAGSDIHPPPVRPVRRQDHHEVRAGHGDEAGAVTDVVDAGPDRDASVAPVAVTPAAERRAPHQAPPPVVDGPGVPDGRVPDPPSDPEPVMPPSKASGPAREDAPVGHDGPDADDTPEPASPGGLDPRVRMLASLFD